ncbi:MAG: rhomboid family intramembrane serine protease, partial [Bacteroidota bacterium]
MSKFLSGKWFTLLLMVTNVVIFALHPTTSTDVYQLLQLGANFAPYTLANEPHRLITCMFLHGGLIHLVVNMYSLYFIGQQVEGSIGSVKFALLYLITGLFASLSSLYFNLFTISVGASGAIFGIYGFHLIKVIRANSEDRQSIILNFIIYIVVLTLAGNALNFDNAAHFGGLFAGALIGLVKNNKKLPLAYLGGVLILFITYWAIPRTQVRYYETYQEIRSIDERTVKIFQSPLTNEDFFDSLERIKEIPAQTAAKLRRISGLDKDLSTDTLVLQTLLDIRDQQIAYFLRGLTEESYVYLDSVEAQTERF